ncbi:MAG: hypothetical protein V3T53_09405 [Phycisphaerales bacterium]
MEVRTLAGFGVVAASFVVPSSSRADFLGVTIVEVTADVGTPEGFVTYRVVANLDGMDLVLAWGGMARAGALDFFTGNGVELLNAGGKYAGLKAEDFPAFPIAEAYDSWVSVASTIDNDGDGSYDEGFLGSDGVHAVIVGSSFHEDAGLVYGADPDKPPFGPEVVMAQFTIPGVPGGGPGDPGHNGFHLEGIVAWAGAGAGFEISPFIVDNIIPAPGGLALLGLAGLASPRRRRCWPAAERG